MLNIRQPINGLVELADSKKLKREPQPESLLKLVKQRRYESNAIDGILGLFLIFSALLIFTFYFYYFFISKFFIGYTGNIILDWIKDDDYYCYLLPATFVSTVFFMYANWSAMKYFRHS